MRPFALSSLAILLAACTTEEQVCATASGIECSALEARVVELESTLSALQDQLETMQKAGYVTGSELDGYVTEEELGTYLTEDDLEGYATTEDLAGLVGTGDLEGYATEAWVTEGFASLDSLGSTQSDVSALQSDVSTLQSDVSTLQSDVSTLQGAGYITSAALTGYATQSWVEAGFTTSTEASDLDSRIALVESDYLVADDMVDVVRSLDTDASYDAADAAELLAVLDALDSARIGRGATVTINLTGSSYSFSDALTLSHPDGDRIEILGSGSGSTSLEFTTTDGVVVEGASSLGLLSGVTILGADQDADGLKVTEGSALVIEDIVVDGFAQFGVVAEANSSLWLVDGSYLSVTGGQYGVSSRFSSYVDVPGAFVDGANSYGLMASGGSVLTGDGSQIDNSGTTGAIAGDHSYVNINGAVIDGANWGIYSGYGSAVEARGVDIVTANTGLYASGHGYIHADGLIGVTSITSGGHDTTDFVYGP